MRLCISHNIIKQSVMILTILFIILSYEKHLLIRACFLKLVLIFNLNYYTLPVYFLLFYQEHQLQLSSFSLFWIYMSHDHRSRAMRKNKIYNHVRYREHPSRRINIIQIVVITWHCLFQQVFIVRKIWSSK